MPNIIRYECDGTAAVWPIPFPFITENEVAVSVALPDGREKQLARGTDYVISGQSVICVMPAGHRLTIWQNAPAPTAAALAQAANYAPAACAAQTMAAPAYEADAVSGQDASQALAELDGKLQTSLAELEKWRAIYSEELQKALQALLQKASESLDQQLANARTELQSTLNNNMGQIGQTLAIAQKTSAEASRAASDAGLAAQTITASRAAQDNAAITAQGWASASQKSADEAYNASCHAWDAATQASIHSRRPGVCAVRKLEDIHACSPGLFIINPHLTHAPTPFFGVWPARDIDDMQWDAVFFISPCLYPDDPRLPPTRPARPLPDPVEATGNGDEWLPCGHSHPQEPVHSCPCTE